MDIDIFNLDVGSIRWFECKKMKYIWDDENDTMFYKLHGIDQEVSLQHFHSMKSGLSDTQHRQR